MHSDNATILIDYDAPLYADTLFEEEVKEAIDVQVLSVNGVHLHGISVQRCTGKGVLIELLREGSPLESVSDWSEVQLWLDEDGDYQHVLEVTKVLDNEILNREMDPEYRTYRMTLRADEHFRRTP